MCVLEMIFINRLIYGVRPITRSVFTTNKYLSYSCWSCGKTSENTVSNLFCSHCRALQKPDSKQNYFKMIGIQETYDIDESVLARRYKELQRYLHPDKFSHKDKKEQIISEEYSSLVNQAYNTLLQPLSRGIYMLQLQGRELKEDTQLDKEFLMGIMEKNEEVENASTDDEIVRLNTENKKVLEDLKRELSRNFFKGDLDEVIRILSRMKYYTSIDNQIQAVIRSKGIIR